MQVIRIYLKLNSLDTHKEYNRVWLILHILSSTSSFLAVSFFCFFLCVAFLLSLFFSFYSFFRSCVNSQHNAAGATHSRAWMRGHKSFAKGGRQDHRQWKRYVQSDLTQAEMHTKREVVWQVLSSLQYFSLYSGKYDWHHKYNLIV